MKCKNCGYEVEETEVFCTNCGEKIVKTNCADTKAASNIKKKMVMLMAAFILVALLGGGVLFGILTTSAKACIEGYAKAIVSENWEEAYQYCVEIDDTDLSKENYVNWAKDNLSNIKAYVLEEVSSIENEKKYKITFTDEKGTQIFKNTYIVEKQDEKKKNFFPRWKIAKSSCTVECVQLSVPEGAEVFLDEMKLEEQLLVNNAYTITYPTTNGTVITQERPVDENGMVTYQIPSLFLGPHSVKVTKQYYADYEEIVIIDENVEDNNPIVLEPKVSESVVQDVCFSVPNGAEFYLDDAKVEDSYLVEGDSGERVTYKIPFLDKGEHKVKAVKKYYKDYESTVEITAEQAENPVVLDLKMRKGQKWRKAYYEFLMAVQNQDVENLKKTVDDIDALYGAPPYDDYAREKSQVEFKLIYLNDDDIPELLLTRCFYGMLFTYYENEVRAISLEGIDGSYRGSSALLWGSRSWFDFTEKEGFILEGGSSGAASTQTYFWEYDSGTNAKLLYEIQANFGAPDNSEINGKTVTAEEAAEKEEECLDKIKGVEVENTKRITDESLIQELDYIP